MKRALSSVQMTVVSRIAVARRGTGSDAGCRMEGWRRAWGWKGPSGGGARRSAEGGPRRHSQSAIGHGRGSPSSASGRESAVGSVGEGVEGSPASFVRDNIEPALPRGALGVHQETASQSGCERSLVGLANCSGWSQRRGYLHLTSREGIVFHLAQGRPPGVARSAALESQRCR